LTQLADGSWNCDACNVAQTFVSLDAQRKYIVNGYPRLDFRYCPSCGAKLTERKPYNWEEL
jgi:hypothetical protein